ncbi:hypothetical protein Pst134EA_031400 [Puccinia striiformis f. sp. tritici]|uniref:uncharacterized protein n=1 Tax=Puccinia striiformis f. sp. tritici TaxID=168172 RepID=UPI002008687E|nr:uncharacterized protein Pst134EA_031400 [Puccinia striiformis f. sp. tritici]KAH9445319.1 hypothetical protein Pst134EA_031400 [Puccinia striiformis f. sp. tritici]
MASNGTSSEHPTAKVASQSLLDPHHKDPFEFDPTEPLVLFIVQAVIIISFCNIIGFFFKRIRQPKVISEVIGGIILGPTAMGRIPHFSHTIFPTSSIPFLSLVANIGLVLFLFIIGLEVDFKLFKQNWRSAAGIGFFGLAIPFGIGAAVAVGIYNRFVDASTVEFGHFLLFICVAFAITAFPVLCRILTELKLLQNPVGIATLAAGVANDVIGWILLALAVTLVNSGAGLTALYVMLTIAAWIVFLAFVVRPIFIVLARRSGSCDEGPTPGITCLVLLMTFTSAWFTQVIGVHSIFGGFLIGGYHAPRRWSLNKLVLQRLKILLPCSSCLSTSPSLVSLRISLSSMMARFRVGRSSAESFQVCTLFSDGTLGWYGLEKAALLARIDGLQRPQTRAVVLNMESEGWRSQHEGFRYVRTDGRSDHLHHHTTHSTILPRKRITIAGGSNLPNKTALEHVPSVMSFVKLLQQPGKSSPAVDGQPGPSAVDTLPSEKHDDPSQTNLSNAPGFLPQVSALRLLELSQRTSDVMKASDVVETKNTTRFSKSSAHLLF